MAKKVTTYKIVRGYFNEEYDKEVIKTRLTFQQAVAHCRDPESSSRTCSSPEGVARTAERGPWFDGFSEED